MGQKVNPHGLRVGVIKDWDSRWYARNEKVGDLLVEDKKIRDYLKKTLYGAGIPKIEIERDNAKTRIYLHCARPGVVIGKGGEDIKKIEAQLVKMTGKPVDLKIVEVRDADTNAQLVAENIAQQLEKRIGFRRAMKNSMGRAMRAGAKGIKTSCSGRLGGAEIARTEHYHDGTIPLQTLRADIDYGFAEAATTYGRIGVKVWIYKGEVLTQAMRGNTIAYGEFGLQAIEPAWITSNQIEAARIAMTRYTKRGGKVWIKIFPDKPVTEKPAETRMGSGKGSPEYWVAVVKPGRVMFEIAGVSEETAREALRLASHKLPVKCKIVKREETEKGGEA